MSLGVEVLPAAPSVARRPAGHSPGTYVCDRAGLPHFCAVSHAILDAMSGLSGVHPRAARVGVFGGHPSALSVAECAEQLACKKWPGATSATPGRGAGRKGVGLFEEIMEARRSMSIANPSCVDGVCVVRRETRQLKL